MRRDKSYRILANGITASNDSWETGLNNNTLIVGTSGAGKTRGYVIPNILASEGSIVVTDTKGMLYDQLHEQLESKGYRVECINFIDPTMSTMGYDPLDHIRVTEGRAREQDMMSVAAQLCPMEIEKEPYWDYAAQGLVASLIGYAMAMLPEEEHNVPTVCALYDTVIDGRYDKLISEMAEEESGAFAIKQYASLKAAKDAEKTAACVKSIAGEKLAAYRFGEVEGLFTMDNRIRFEDLRRRKTAVFIHVSDCDRSMDRLVALFYAQLFRALIESDTDGIPVHVILDDFACGCRIKDFDNIISVIRSRGVYASIIIQSLSQLEGLYQRKAPTIVENCDTMLYLGGNDPETARMLGERTNKPSHAILSMPLSDALVIQRGRSVRKVHRYRMEESCESGLQKETDNEQEKQTGICA